MIFCEQCRIKNNWPRSPGYPLVGTVSDSKCELCRKIGEQHDLPALMLKPDSQRTTEEKIVYNMMQQAYQDKAETLMVTHVSGRNSGNMDHEKTVALRKILIEVNGKIDWYTTYQLRLKAQENYQQQEQIKRDRRNYVL